MKDPFDIIIVGAGASGIVAAIQIKKLMPNLKVCILEQNNQIAKKIKATGNGRCNILPREFQEYSFHSQTIERVLDILKNKPMERILNFWNDLGLELRILDDGIYPYSLRSESVLGILENQLKHHKITVFLEHTVSEIQSHLDYYNVCSSTPDGEKRFRSRTVLLSSSKLGQVGLGSTGAVLQMLQDKGVKVEACFPALDNLIIKNHNKSLHGNRFRAFVSAWDMKSDRLLSADAGELLFNKSGISGIPILQISAAVHAASNNFYSIDKQKNFIYKEKPSRMANVTLQGREKQSVVEETKKIFKSRFWSFSKQNLRMLVVDFFPHIDSASFEAWIHEYYAKLQNDCLLLCTAFFPRELAEYLARHLEKNQVNGTIDFMLLKSFPITLEDKYNWSHAQVAAGGISFENLQLDSLMFRNYPGLFAAGEILDVYGDCGGYNLLWAWSSALFVADDITRYLGREDERRESLI